MDGRVGVRLREEPDFKRLIADIKHKYSALQINRLQ
jgi:hypothetical protein